MPAPPSAEHFTVYSIRRGGEPKPLAEEAPPGDAIRVDSDRYGNVLFKKDEITSEKLDRGLDNCLALAGKLIQRAREISADYHVESSTLKLALDAEVGLIFVGDASLEAGIEIEIKREQRAKDPT